jgi:hypothetical protein
VPSSVFGKNLEISMTDPFEDIVRNALRGTSGAAGEMPTYHGAWQRGRRRRWIKRSALVATGAFVLLAALTVNLGRLPGSEPIETSDVATGAAAAVAATPIFEPTPLATTALVETPSLSDGDTDSVQAAPTASAISPADTPTVVPQAAATPTTVAQTTVPPAAVTPTVVAATALPPTAVPQTSVPQTGAPTAPVPTPEALSTPPPTVEALPTADAETAQEPASLAGTAQQPVDPGGTDEPLGPPQVAFTTVAPADAVLLDGAVRGVALPCDLDQDGVADATCELLADYSCTGDGDVEPGYSMVDSNGDSVGDTCTALDLTICDTTNDGLGDTPCIIDVSVAPG